jgi:hypothetical protein
VLVTFIALLVPLVAAVFLLMKCVFGSHKFQEDSSDPRYGNAHLAMPMLNGASGYSGRSTKRTWFSFEQFKKRAPNGGLSQSPSLKSMDSKSSDTSPPMDTVYSFSADKPAAGAAGTADMAAGTAAAAGQAIQETPPGPDGAQHWLTTIRAFQMSDSDGSGTLSPANSGSITGTPRALGLTGSMPLSITGSGPQPLLTPQVSTPFEPMRERILHVALEYSIPHLGFNNQLMFGGLGMVVDTFIKQWPGPMAIIAPLYKACYAAAPGCSGTSSDQDGVVRPSFLAPYERPLLTLTVDAAGTPNAVEVFRMVHENVTYYLVQVRDGGPAMLLLGEPAAVLCLS